MKMSRLDCDIYDDNDEPCGVVSFIEDEVYVNKIDEDTATPISLIKDDETVWLGIQNQLFLLFPHLDKSIVSIQVDGAKQELYEQDWFKCMFDDVDNSTVTIEQLHAMRDKEEEFKLDINLPDDHFLTDFVNWLSSITDGYYEYQVVSGLWLLSALTHGKVVLKLKQELIKPNLYMMVFGKSTTSRKSTVVNKARNIYMASSDTILYNDDFSLEGYMEMLSEQPISHFVRDEAAGLIAKNHKKYNEGIFEAECAIYDGQDYRKTLAKGREKKQREYIITKPFVTHLYATTPSNFANHMTLEDFECGYGYRFMYAHPNYKKDRMPLEMESDNDFELWTKVISNTRKLFNYFRGSEEIQFRFDDDAIEYYNETLAKLEDEADEIDNDMLNSALGRSQVHVLKLAMLLEIGKNEPSFVLTKNSIEVAMYMVMNYFLPTCMNIISRLQEDVKFNQIEKCISVIRRLGGTTSHKLALQHSKLKAKEFNECIETMIESDTVKVFTEKGSNAKHYLLTESDKKIKNFNRGNQVNHINSLTHSTHDAVNLVNSIGEDIERGIVATTVSKPVNEVNFVKTVNILPENMTESQKSLTKYIDINNLVKDLYPYVLENYPSLLINNIQECTFGFICKHVQWSGYERSVAATIEHLNERGWNNG